MTYELTYETRNDLLDLRNKEWLTLRNKKMTYETRNDLLWETRNDLRIVAWKIFSMEILLSLLYRNWSVNLFNQITCLSVNLFNN